MTEKHGHEEWDRLWSQQSSTRILYCDRQIFRHVSRVVGWRGRSVLELGCGRGMISYLGQRAGAHENVLLDSSPKALDLARDLFSEFGDRVTFVLNTVEEARLDRKFDIVMSITVSQYFVGQELRSFVRTHRDFSQDLVLVVSLAGPHHNDRRTSHPKTVAQYGSQKPITRQEMAVIFKDLGMTVVANERFYPMYGVSLSSLLGWPSWPGLNGLERLVSKLRVAQIINGMLNPFGNQLGGLLVTVGRV